MKHWLITLIMGESWEPAYFKQEELEEQFQNSELLFEEED